MTEMCPHCGFNLVADQPVEIGDWSIVPRDGAYYRGRRVVRRSAWTTILATLAQQNGRSVTAEVLQARFSDSEGSNVVQVQICRLRQSLRQQGAPDPIESKHGARGYRWRMG